MIVLSTSNISHQEWDRAINEWLLEKNFSLSWDAQCNDRRIQCSPPSKLLFVLNDSPPPHLLLLGKSAAGKGTLSQMLADRYGYRHISIGDIHRNENRKGTRIGLKIRELVFQNKIASTEMAQITYHILRKKIRDIVIAKQVFILDNFPTCPLHVPFILQIISKYNLQNRVILVVPEISDSEAISRLENRVVCSSDQCGRSYNLTTFPPTHPGKCDLCHSTLVRRIDDTAEIIKCKRMPFYRENILPTIRLLSEKLDFFPIQKIFDLFGRYLNLYPGRGTNNGS